MKLRHPVTVQRIKADATRLSDNKIDKSNPANWETYVSRRAEVLETGGRETVQRRQIVAEADFLLRLRADPETKLISTSMRIVYGSLTLGIVSKATIEGFVECQCKLA